ncbi:MAG: acyl carrier protein [Myxococcales bacterium]|nr:acyl carrier protein [Myxococcales bacterium]
MDVIGGDQDLARLGAAHVDGAHWDLLGSVLVDGARHRDRRAGPAVQLVVDHHQVAEAAGVDLDPADAEQGGVVAHRGPLESQPLDAHVVSLHVEQRVLLRLPFAVGVERFQIIGEEPRPLGGALALGEQRHALAERQVALASEADEGVGRNVDRAVKARVAERADQRRAAVDDARPGRQDQPRFTDGDAGLERAAGGREGEQYRGEFVLFHGCALLFARRPKQPACRPEVGPRRWRYAAPAWRTRDGGLHALQGLHGGSRCGAASGILPPVEPAEITDRVRGLVVELVADVLGVRPEKVQPSSRLMDDLGAESLDYLDIVFQLEDRFQVKITRGELEHAARGDLTDEEFAPGGVVSERGLVRLRELLPEAGDRLRPGLRASAILSLFTVETFVKIVARKLAAAAS